MQYLDISLQKRFTNQRHLTARLQGGHAGIMPQRPSTTRALSALRLVRSDDGWAFPVESAVEPRPPTRPGITPLVRKDLISNLTRILGRPVVPAS